MPKKPHTYFFLQKWSILDLAVIFFSVILMFAFTLKRGIKSRRLNPIWKFSFMMMIESSQKNVGGDSTNKLPGLMRNLWVASSMNIWWEFWFVVIRVCLFEAQLEVMWAQEIHRHSNFEFTRRKPKLLFVYERFYYAVLK